MPEDTWEIGKITWLDPNKKTGVIARDGADGDVYFEFGESGVVENKMTPRTGQMVQYRTEKGPLGLIATKVVVVAGAAKLALKR